MPWSKVSESIWSRPLEPGELALRNVSYLTKALNREQAIISSIFSLEKLAGGSNDLTEALLQTWTVLRYKSPLIAVKTNGDDLIYQTPSPDELKAWQTATFIVHSENDITAQQYIHQVEWHDECTLHWFTRASQVLFRIHHWLNDGIGAVHLGRSFFKLLAQNLDQEQPTVWPIFGDEWQRLQPGLDEASGLPTKTNEDIQAKGLQMALSLVGVPSAGLPYTGPPKLPGASKKARMVSKAPLDSILAKCKENHIALGAAVHSALTAVIFEVALSDHQQLAYSTFAIFNYRTHLSQTSDQWPMGNYIMTLPVAVSKDDFLENAKRIHAFYQQPISGPDFADREIYVAFMRDFAYLLATPPPAGAPLPTNPIFTSMGLLDPYLDQNYGPITIKDIDISVDVVAPAVWLSQWTWAGVFNIGVNYNDAYWTAGFIDDFMKRVEKNLLAGLGLN